MATRWILGHWSVLFGMTAAIAACAVQVGTEQTEQEESTGAALGSCPGQLLSCGGRCVNTATDAKNCGRCGHSCLTGGSCAAGVCQPMTVASQPVIGQAIDYVTDGSSLVWADPSVNAIYGAPIPVTSKAVLANDAKVSDPRNVAFSSSTGDVYWTEQGGIVGHTTFPVGLTQPSILTQQVGNISGLLADNSGAYFLISTGGSITFFNCLLSLPTCFVDSSVFCSGCSSDPASATAGFFFYGDVGNSRVVIVTSTPGTFTNNYVTGQPNVQYLTSDGTFVYWVSGTSTFTVARAPFSAPTTAQIVLNNAPPTIGLATDGTNLYLADGLQIYYVNIAQGAAASGALTATALTHFTAPGDTVMPKFAAGAVYFFRNGGIDRIAPP